MKVPVCCPHVFLIQLGTTRVEFQGSAEKEREIRLPLLPPAPPCSPAHPLLKFGPLSIPAPSHTRLRQQVNGGPGRAVDAQAMLDRASHARKGDVREGVADVLRRGSCIVGLRGLPLNHRRQGNLAARNLRW